MLILRSQLIKIVFFFSFFLIIINLNNCLPGNLIRNIIFDLGNVLLNFQPAQFLTRYINDQNQISDFIAKVIKNELWHKLDRGVISLDNARDEYIAKFPEESGFITSFFNHWKEMLTPINENIKILYELKANGYPLYALSNFTWC